MPRAMYSTYLLTCSGLQSVVLFVVRIMRLHIAFVYLISVMQVLL